MSKLQTIDDKKRTLELKGQAQMFVFGMEDGLISILGLIAGVYGAVDDRAVVLIAGITGAIAAAFSMAAGALLGSEAERDLLLAEIESTKNEVEAQPYIAQEGIMEELQEMGLDKSDAFRVVRDISDKEEVLFGHFKGLVLKLPSVEDSSPIQDAGVMFAAFVLGALFPILPYVLIDGSLAYVVSVILSSSVLFSLGAMKGWLSRKSILVSGLKFLAVALVAGIGSEFIGSLITQAFG